MSRFGAFVFILVINMRLIYVVMILKHLTILLIFPMAVNDIDSTVWKTLQDFCISFIVLSSADLLGSGWQGGYSSIFLPIKTDGGGIFPVLFILIILYGIFLDKLFRSHPLTMIFGLHKVFKIEVKKNVDWFPWKITLFHS